MKQIKETKKEDFLESMNELAQSYDASNISNKKTGSSAQQQSTDNSNGASTIRGINSLTDAEWRKLFEQESDIYD